MIHEGPLTWRIGKDKTVGMDLPHRPVLGEPGELGELGEPGDLPLHPQHPPRRGHFIPSTSSFAGSPLAPRCHIHGAIVPPGC